MTAEGAGRRTDPLPSWAEGPTRAAVLDFLEAAEDVPVERRVAAFDNDGTLICERPQYVQLEFFLDALRSAVDADPAVRARPEYGAVLDGDVAAIGELGMERIAVSLAELFVGLTPDEFVRLGREFVARTSHPTLDRPLAATVYRPMLELIDELRRRRFTVYVVTGGGTEFVRAISDDLYGVAPDGVVGTLVAHEFARDHVGRPVLRRTAQMLGDVNEGAAKVTNIQTQLGRAPIIAGGNSGGDREMLEWAMASGSPSLALLIDHDDADREFSYLGRAVSFDESEPITDVGRRLGWTVVSMARDWTTMFPGSST